jgi:epoxyqueuosine reductase
MPILDIIRRQLHERQFFDYWGPMNTPNETNQEYLNLISQKANSLGLYFFGVASLEVTQNFRWFQEWMNEKKYGSMSWLTNHLDIRAKPSLLLPAAKSALVFGFNYNLGDKWSRGEQNASPKIAQYARLKDYHKFLKAKLKSIQDYLEETIPEKQSWRITVDSAPLLERAIAMNTNQAFIGKNTCLIHPLEGSFFLLGEIISSLSFESLSGEVVSRPSSRSKKGGCGTCRRCQVHCPTGALDQEYKLDASKCISYWTIEHRGEIPVQYWKWVGRYVFGCDICQLVCPYNRDKKISLEAKELMKVPSQLKLEDVVVMDQNYYEHTFGGTPMTRAKRSGLRRNALIAGIVTNNPNVLSLIPTLEKDEDVVIQKTLAQIPEYKTL